MRLEGLPAGPHAIHGSWSATRWQYTSRADPARTVDVVCDLGGVVTLSLSEGTYVLTCDVAGRRNQSVGGVFTMSGDDIHLRASGASDPERVRFRIAAETLALSADESRWDFDGDGRDEPASLIAVFVRL
jgi:hypothetical protein